jgi:catalase
MPDWEREDLVLNLVTALRECDEHIKEAMVSHFMKCDAGFGTRIAEGIGVRSQAGDWSTFNTGIGL